MDQQTEDQIVIAALENPKFKWRTLEGVSVETKIPVDKIRSLIEQNRDRIIQSSIPAVDGKPLFTTRDHFIKFSTPFEKIVGAFKNRVS